MTIISVVICVYNEELMIGKCIKSLMIQKDVQFKYEIIIIDDESSDDTGLIVRSIIEEYDMENPKMIYIRQKHKGLSVARNTGIKHSNGKIISFIDGDAIADKEYIKSIYDKFQSDQNVYIIGGCVENINNDSFIARFLHKAHYQANMILEDNKVVGTNMSFRRDVFETHSFYDVFDRRGDETSLLFEVKRNHPMWKIVYFKKAIVYHEHLTSINKWLVQRIYSGKLTGFIENTIDQNMSKGKMLKRIIIRGFNAMLLPIMFISIVVPIDTSAKKYILCVLLIAWVIRQSLIRLVLANAFKLTKKEFGWVGGGSAIIIRIVGQIFQDYGYCVGFLSSLRKRRIKLKQTVGAEIYKTSK